MDTPPNPNDQEPDLSAPGSGPGRLTVSEFWELPGDPAFCPELRHRIRRSLADYPHAVDDAELVVAEPVRQRLPPQRQRRWRQNLGDALRPPHWPRARHRRRPGA